MPYLQRIDYRPSMEDLRPFEQQFIQTHVDAYGAEIVIEGQAIRWEHIDEVEIAVAPRVAGPAGWLVKKLFLGDETRYHLGIYFGSREAVLPNITWDTARYVLQQIAYYAPQPIQYTGPEDLVALTEV